MALTQEIYRAYTAILKEEMLVAMGCTEPIAISYAAAIVREALGKLPTRVRAGLSGNIIKNVKSVVVPATGGMHGIGTAIVAGLVAGNPDKRLEVLTILTEQDVPSIKALSESLELEIYELETEHPFEVLIEGYADGKSASAHLAQRHTNVVKVTRNDEDLTARYKTEEAYTVSETHDRSLLNVKDIIEFAESVELDELAPLLSRQIEMNTAIAEEVIQNDWGASIGKVLYNNGQCNTRTKARAYAAAGSDARMSGCELPVSIISGSGNQGITASVPIAIYAERWEKSREEMLRALIVSNLITIHQKTGIGCLSAYCGAISAGCGCGCGIAFLAGGRYHEIAHTLVNSVAILSGTICDGAKPSCAAKIAMAVEAGIMGFEMTRHGHEFLGGDGIVTKGVENTIRNIGRLAKQGMSATDKEIISIMLGEN